MPEHLRYCRKLIRVSTLRHTSRILTHTACNALCEGQMTRRSSLQQTRLRTRRVVWATLSTCLALASMSFDGLRTVKADDKYTALEGKLIRYGNASAQIAFATGIPSTKHVIVIGGLGSGIDFNEYCPMLSLALKPKGWAVVQIMLTSAYIGYGVASLDQDAGEIHMLVDLLRREFDAKTIVLLGHSTGCQDSVQYMQKYSTEKPPMAGVILQASVSDREALAHVYSGTPALIRQAQAMVAEGRGEDILTRQWDSGGASGTPITARRYLSFTVPGGDDDMFSSDLTDAELQERLGPCGTVPTYVVFSGADENVPPGIDKLKLVSRFKQALGPLSRSSIIDGAEHELDGYAEQFTQLVEGFLENITGSSLE